MMIQLNLQPHEADILRETLETAVSDLRMEVAGTDNQPFREELKEREHTLREILGTLLAAPIDRPGQVPAASS